ncbi:MAG: hypothetical protein QG602_2757, partial [Verrucomicrobiota bacterium]|nr:hypothetical protein [Verrucomicrobiota bacterium]
MMSAIGCAAGSFARLRMTAWTFMVDRTQGGSGLVFRLST